METESVSEDSGPYDMEAIEKKHSYKIEEALKYNKKSCVSFVQFTNTICCYIGVSEPHDMEVVEKTAVNFV